MLSASPSKKSEFKFFELPLDIIIFGLASRLTLPDLYYLCTTNHAAYKIFKDNQLKNEIFNRKFNEVEIIKTKNKSGDCIKVTDSIIELIKLGIRLNLSNNNLKEIIKNIDLDTLKKRTESPLYLAVSFNALESAAMLLDMGRKNRGLVEDDTLPLHLAVKKGYMQMVELLVENGEDINVRHMDTGSSPLHVAMEEGRLDLVNYLLSKGADVDLLVNNRFSALYVGATHGRAACVARLLQVAPHLVNLPVPRGGTPLYMASQFGYADVCEILLKAGADIENKDESFFTDNTPLGIASAQGHEEVVKVLIRYHAQLDYLALSQAVAKGHTNIVKLFLEKGVNPEHPILYEASYRGYEKIVELLLKFGACVDKQSIFTETALYAAVKLSHEKVVKLLLDFGADTNLVAEGGQTCLHLACQNNKISIIQLLLQHGANPLAIDRNDKTPAQTTIKFSSNVMTYMDKIENLARQVVLPKLASQPKTSFDVMIAVDILLPKLNENNKLIPLLNKTESYFGRMVILFASFDIGPTLDIVYALGYEDIESAKGALSDAIIVYLSQDSQLIELLQTQVIFPLVNYLARENCNKNDELRDTLLALAFFEGQVRNALPKQEHRIREVMVEETNQAQKLNYVVPHGVFKPIPLPNIYNQQNNQQISVEQQHAKRRRL